MNPETPPLAPMTEWEAFPPLLDAHLVRLFRGQAGRYAYGTFFEPLYDDLSRYVVRRGKRLRPLLLAASYRFLGGEKATDDPALLGAATAMELFHAFTLIHDDVIDRADLRRGLPSFHRAVEGQLGGGRRWEKEAEGIALVAGNLLHALAIETLLAADFPPPRREAALRRFLQAVADTGAGEVGDILFGTRDLAAVSVAEIERVAHLKTTRYTFGAPFALGAILAGPENEEAILAALARIAEPLGLAFQIANDLHEFHAPHPSSDLLAGKKTLLLRLAYEHLAEADRSFLRLALALPEGDPARLPMVRELIVKSGAPDRLRDRWSALRREARTELTRSSLPALGEFSGLLDWLDTLSPNP